MTSACVLGVVGAPSAPEAHVKLTITINGMGTVYGGGRSFVCKTPCGGSSHAIFIVRPGTVKLKAVAAAAWKFTTWSSACRPKTEPLCVLHVRRPTRVAATFVPGAGPAVAGTYAGTTTQNATVTFVVLPGGTALKDFLVGSIDLSCQPPDFVHYSETSDNWRLPTKASIAPDGVFVLATTVDTTPYDDVRFQWEIRVTGRFSGQGATGGLELDLTITIPRTLSATCHLHCSERHLDSVKNA
jgi:hypothetical protein